jgi:tRNA threonylcarbamoyladenosine biosynthesis protein TsaE
VALKYIFISNSEEQTKKIASQLAAYLFPGAVITINGPLGSGKTTFVSGVARGLGITERVISPTFNILKCYFESKPSMFHIDAYRLENRMSELGLEEFIECEGVTLIEWPDYIITLIPKNHMRIEMETIHKNQRRLTFHSIGSKYDDLLIKLEAANHV